MRLAGHLALLSILPWLTAAAAQPSLQTVIARMRTANGALYTAHVASSAKLPSGDELEDDAQGTRLLARQCASGLCTGSYFDGERWYSVNINATALPRSSAGDPYERAVREIASLSFLDPRFSAGGGTLSDGGTVRFDGRECRQIEVESRGAGLAHVFVDTHTWLPAGLHDAVGDTFTLRDYRRVERYWLPYEVDRNGAVLRRYDARTIVHAQLDHPAGLPMAFPDGPAQAAVRSQGNTPVANCTIGGQTVACLIDSGNSGLSMSLELAESLNLPAIGAFRVAGLGDYATEVVRAGPLQLGNVALPAANYIVLADIHRYGYDLVLGADLLAGSRVTIDYSKHSISFERSARGDPGPANIPLRFKSLVPVIDVQLAGVPAQLTVDTGDQSNVNLSERFYAAHPSLFVPTRTANVGGVGGESVQTMGEISSVRIGDLVATRQEIGATRSLLGTGDGHLGAAFLSKFKVVLDYPQERMGLIPAK